MHSPEAKAPAAAIWALGLTQIVGYGTLYYSFAILAPAMAAEFALPSQWVYGALSAALFLGSLLAPTAGRLADRHGAGRVMTFGSFAAALSLAACAAAPARYSFVAALIAMEIASGFVLYAAAFVAIVQMGSVGAQRSITHLTLIAGFASTLFWPLTTVLHQHLSWREVYVAFAALHVLLCVPIHAWIARLANRRRLASAGSGTGPEHPDSAPSQPARARALLLMMMAGFALEGFVMSAILLHMVPLLTTLGLGTAGVAAATLFGPAQVASRLVNMVFGGRLRQTVLAIVSAALLAAGLGLLLATTPMTAGTTLFVVLFGLGSGLASIIGGTLPLEVFGRRTYGLHVGWMSAARQFSSAFAPFVFALMMAAISVPGAVAVLMLAAALGACAFAAVAVLAGRMPGL
ncbi:arsenite efflux MFS transporter ArsK [Mesorhizobium sp. ZMM04-5]|uniref:Arsenite efflux MFS transporter ArsK n=1 Tax=Mesorhizobium marinum TaxID=3228790 RepID=A0ABV3R5Y4_9HYPH